MPCKPKSQSRVLSLFQKSAVQDPVAQQALSDDLEDAKRKEDILARARALRMAKRKRAPALPPKSAEDDDRWSEFTSQRKNYRSGGRAPLRPQVLFAPMVLQGMDAFDGLRFNKAASTADRLSDRYPELAAWRQE